MYTPSFKVKSNGVPVLSKREIEVIGENFILDFCPDALTQPQAINIDDFVELYLGMKIDYQYLSNDGRYLGMTVFNDTDIQNQEDYKRKYDSYVERYDAAKEKLDRLEKQKNERLIKSDAIGGFMFELSERSETLTVFDDRLWLTVIDTVTAYHDGRLIFKFHNGSEIEA